MSKKISEFDEATTLSGFTIAGIQGGDNKRAPSSLLQDFIETITSDILDGFFVNGKGTTFNGDRYDLGGIIEDSSVEIGSIATLGDNAMSYLSFINDGTESTLALGSQADISFIPSIAYLALSPDYGRLIWDLGNGTVEETIEVGVNGIRLNYDNGTVSNSLEVNDLAIEAIFANSSYSFADGIFILTATDGINGTSTIGANATQATMSVQQPDTSNYSIGVTNVGITLQYNPFGADPSQILVDADIRMEANGDIILPDFVNANLGTDATGRLINLDNLALRKIITGTTYEVEQEDNGYLLICTNATGTLITIPSTLTDNFSFATLRAQGAGVVDHTDDGTSVLLTYNNQYSLEEENTACTWVCTEVEVFYGFGAFGPSGISIGLQDVLNTDGVLTEDLSTISGPNGILMYFGESPSSITGLDWSADQFILTSDELALTNAANTISIFFDSVSDPMNPLISISGNVHHVDGTFDFTSTPTVGGNTLATETYANVAAQERVEASIWKQPVAAASTANVSLSSAGTTMDGVSINTIGVRVLLKDQSTQTQNGIYYVSANSPNVVLTRATDFDGSGVSSVAQNARIPVNGGSVNGGRVFGLTTANPVVGTSNLIFKDAFYYSGDLLIDNAAKGLVLKSANGHYWRFLVDNSGNMANPGNDLGTTLPA